MLLLRARILRRALLSCHVTLLVRGGGGWCAQISMETRTSYGFPIKGAEKRPPQHDIPLRAMKSYHHLLSGVIAIVKILTFLLTKKTTNFIACIKQK